MTWQQNHPIPQHTTTSQLWTSTDWAYNRMKSALEDICDLLGPEINCEANECEGCQYELTEALDIALVALGRKPVRHVVPHRRKDASDE